MQILDFAVSYQLSNGFAQVYPSLSRRLTIFLIIPLICATMGFGYYASHLAVFVIIADIPTAALDAQINFARVHLDR